MSEPFDISDDKSRLEINRIAGWLADSYWAASRPLATIERSIENSHCFGAYADGQQIGFARVVTDSCTFAWLCDVVVDPAWRGKGLGKALVQSIIAHPDYEDIRLIALGTKDAHGLYAQYGWGPVPEGRWMVRRGSSYQIN